MNAADPFEGLLGRLSSQQAGMVEALDLLVSSESPSDDSDLLQATAAVVANLGEQVLDRAPDWLPTAGPPGLRWDLPGVGTEGPPVLLLAHYDTVWPAGTLDRWPFTVTGDRATGPGAFDMKAGLVQGMFALAALEASDHPRPPVVLLVTGDEEIGSPSGRALVETAAGGTRAVLVLEPSVDGALKTARKGVGNYRIRVTGRAAHAGLEPEKGINALVGAAHVALASIDGADPDAGTTITPTMMTAGSSPNTVAASASVAVDVRASTAQEQARADTYLRELRAPNGATAIVEGGINRPPLEEHSSAELLEVARRAAGRCGLAPPASAAVGGGSDGNFTAALGIPTLDGLGAVGAGAHAEGEYTSITAMPQRAALVAALIAELGEESR